MDGEGLWVIRTLRLLGQTVLPPPFVLVSTLGPHQWPQPPAQTSELSAASWLMGRLPKTPATEIHKDLIKIT